MVAKKIERLGELLQKGLITQEEYNIKKKELLKEF
ncbi:MAG: SHOCT domain-containing protein [Deltaproteobacteria bacterium]|nr:SHOCT domain-containing protein [Deltaproteobacteria bacterium]